jgi:hypothetical protein
MKRLKTSKGKHVKQNRRKFMRTTPPSHRHCCHHLPTASTTSVCVVIRSHVKNFFYPHPCLLRKQPPKTVSLGVPERVSTGILLYSLECNMTTGQKGIGPARNPSLFLACKLLTGFQYKYLESMHTKRHIWKVSCTIHPALHDDNIGGGRHHATHSPACMSN